MTRLGKKEERRGRSPRRHKAPSKKTGPKKDNFPKGYREHPNAVVGEAAKQIFVPKVKSV